MSALSNDQKKKWEEHIQAWRESGLTQQEYCRENGLTPHRFWYWKRKLCGSNKTGTAENKMTAKDSRFVPVNVKPPVFSSDGLVLTLPGGVCLSGITPHNLPIAQRLAELLK